MTGGSATAYDPEKAFSIRSPVMSIYAGLPEPSSPVHGSPVVADNSLMVNSVSYAEGYKPATGTVPYPSAHGTTQPLGSERAHDAIVV
jgi:hypothetical protein